MYAKSPWCLTICSFVVDMRVSIRPSCHSGSRQWQFAHRWSPKYVMVIGHSFRGLEVPRRLAGLECGDVNGQQWHVIRLFHEWEPWLCKGLHLSIVGMFEVVCSRWLGTVCSPLAREDELEGISWKKVDWNKMQQCQANLEIDQHACFWRSCQRCGNMFCFLSRRLAKFWSPNLAPWLDRGKGMGCATQDEPNADKVLLASKGGIHCVFDDLRWASTVPMVMRTSWDTADWIDYHPRKLQGYAAAFRFVMSMWHAFGSKVWPVVFNVFIHVRIVGKNGIAQKLRYQVIEWNKN